LRRRPAGQRNQLERCAHTPLGVACLHAVCLDSRSQRRPRCEGAAAVAQGVGLAHAAQLAHQGDGVGIRNVEELDVRYRTIEAGALQ
jgi:hypothetical protein